MLGAKLIFGDYTVDLRQAAAACAIEYVRDGMVLGVGTGRTTRCFIELLGKKVQKKEIGDILAVPTSEASAARLRELGVPLTSLVDHPALDLAVDGADEVDPHLNLIKGLGRALLREKVVEIHARQFIVVVEDNKLVERLGSHCPVPVEILPFEALAHVNWLKTLAQRAELWLETDGSPAVTDNGNYLARCWFKDGIPDVYALGQELDHRPGILEHGLFLDMATQVIVASPAGNRILERKRAN
jgi:ribose 5-phosphate isomerase A